jgi:hypothetical protein
MAFDIHARLHSIRRTLRDISLKIMTFWSLQYIFRPWNKKFRFFYFLFLWMSWTGANRSKNIWGKKSRKEEVGAIGVSKKLSPKNWCSLLSTGEWEGLSLPEYFQIDDELLTASILQNISARLLPPPHVYTLFNNSHRWMAHFLVHSSVASPAPPPAYIHGQRHILFIFSCYQKRSNCGWWNDGGIKGI